MKTRILVLALLMLVCTIYLNAQNDMWGTGTSGQILKVDYLEDPFGSTYRLIMEPSILTEFNSNIGIGVSQPSEKLHVSGNILSSGNILGTNIQGSIIKTPSIRPILAPSDIDISATLNNNRFLVLENGNFSLGDILISHTNYESKFEVISIEESKPAVSITSNATTYGKGLLIKSNSAISEPLAIKDNTNTTVFKIMNNGNIDFTGYLKQNGNEIKPSEWIDHNNGIYYNNGFIGIGTDNPLANLQIADDFTFIRRLGSTANYICKNAYYDSEFKYVNTGTSSMINFTPPGDILFNTAPQGNANTPISYSVSLAIKNDGKVGIGTSSPTEKLHVAGNQILSGTIKVDGTSYLNGIVLDNDSDITNADQIIGQNDLHFSGSNPNNFDLYISADGNIGLGHNNPAAKLHSIIQANDNDRVAIFGNDDDRTMFFIPQLGSQAINYISHEDDFGIFWNDGDGQGGKNGTAGFVIAPHEDNTGGIRIDKDGNVGIKNNTPNAALDVNGTIKATTFDIENFNTDDLSVSGLLTAGEILVVGVTKWKDEVFYDDYNLLSLSEIEQFVKKNHHLPDIPSEKEVLSNGYNVGEMNALLLQKVEELTLYIIEQEKRIVELENK